MESNTSPFRNRHVTKTYTENTFARCPHKYPGLVVRKLQIRQNQVRGTSKPRRDENARKRITFLGAALTKELQARLGRESWGDEF